ncbi:hypothetical protein CPB83DRAFT_881378 [Crepidotus variabilis]|uniref:Uncharacterized protein n=1 Tax=Crepidotus variabilis TaxID=179855 RepID=A0A9P6EL49_9AGAR|nr:hypothetical protein CPB83DRAFT_881378 [Crepidotus variabilis]
MRFNILVAASFLVTLAVGLVIPVDSVHSRDIGAREDFENYEIVARAPGFGLNILWRKARSYAEEALSSQGVELLIIINEQNFSNNNHHAPKPFHSKNFVSGMKGSGHEYPLPNKAGAGKGPARVVMQANSAGKLKYKGVVAHDQSRPAGSPGHNDHFRVRPRIGRV